MRSITGSIALVTGATRGIGRAVSNALRDAGATVVSLSRSAEPATSDGHANIRCDMTNPAEITRAIAQLVERHGVPDIVVNNAGVFQIKPVVDTTLEDFEAHVAVNLQAPFLVLRELLPHLIRKGYAQIVSIGSIADHVAFPGNAAYAASKYGLRGLHEVIRKELTGTDVRTTLVSPGPTNTGLWDSLDPAHAGDIMDRDEMLAAEDVAQAVLFAVTRPARVNVELIHLGPAGIR